MDSGKETYLIEILEHFIGNDKLLFDHVALADFFQNDSTVWMIGRVAVDASSWMLEIPVADGLLDVVDAVVSLQSGAERR